MSSSSSACVHTRFNSVGNLALISVECLLSMTLLRGRYLPRHPQAGPLGGLHRHCANQRGIGRSENLRHYCVARQAVVAVYLRLVGNHVRRRQGLMESARHVIKRWIVLATSSNEFPTLVIF